MLTFRSSEWRRATALRGFERLVAAAAGHLVVDQNSMSQLLPYDPGVIPSAPAPAKGEKIRITLPGFPPYKEIRASIRNPMHPRYSAFVELRKAATKAMAGRAWYFGAIGMDLTIRSPRLPGKLRLVDYAAGIQDTLDGSHGFGFTYLPVVFGDDCQVCAGRSVWKQAEEESHTVVFEFL